MKITLGYDISAEGDDRPRFACQHEVMFLTPVADATVIKQFVKDGRPLTCTLGELRDWLKSRATEQPAPLAEVTQ